MCDLSVVFVIIQGRLERNLIWINSRQMHICVQKLQIGIGRLEKWVHRVDRGCRKWISPLAGALEYRCHALLRVLLLEKEAPVSGNHLVNKTNSEV